MNSKHIRKILGLIVVALAALAIAAPVASAYPVIDDDSGQVTRVQTSKPQAKKSKKSKKNKNGRKAPCTSGGRQIMVNCPVVG